MRYTLCSWLIGSRSTMEYPAQRATLASRVAAIKDVRGQRQQKGRHVYAGELEALLRVCIEDSKPSGVRDAAMIALAWVTGTRRGEIAGLQLVDYTPTGENEGDLVIRGKGDKVRTCQ